MNAKQLERASYLAAHAVLSANISAPELACPGARRSHMVDVIADTIKSVFELHCSAFDESTDWWASVAPIRRSSESRREPASKARQKVQLAMQELR